MRAAWSAARSGRASTSVSGKADCRGHPADGAHARYRPRLDFEHALIPIVAVMSASTLPKTTAGERGRAVRGTEVIR
jgi:hypothetical protein